MVYASHSLVWEVVAGHCREVGSSSCSVSPLVPTGIPPVICDSAPQLFRFLPVREPIVGQLQCSEFPSCPPASSIPYGEVEMAGCISDSLGNSRGDFNLDGLNPLPNKFSQFVWEPSVGMGSVLLNSGVPSSTPAARMPFAEVVKDGCYSDSFALEAGNCRGAVRLAGLDPLPNCFSQLAVEHLRGEVRMGGKSPSLKDGRPAIFLSEAEMLDLSKPLHLTLVGKFPAGRPKWVEVNKFFSDLKLRGEFKIANLDARHMFIHLQHLDDYIRLFSKQFQYINGYTVKFLKWTIDFEVNTESAVCPVWISLPRLGLHLYTPELLFSIASVYGRPLRLDYATRHWSRPSAARILVEMDLRSHHSSEVWIGSDSNGYFQKVCFENLPRYCMHCRKIGHNDDNCFLLFPELRKEHGLKNSMGNGMHSNVELHNGFDGNFDVEGGGASTSNGGVMLEQLDNSSGAGVNTLASVDGLQAEILDGNVSFLDNMSGQDILGAEKHVPLVEDVGKECIHRDVVSVDEGSLTLPGVDGVLLGSLARDENVSDQKLVGVESNDILNASMDNLERLALFGPDIQLPQLDDVGKGCNQQDDGSMDGVSMGSDLDMSPRGDLLLYHGDCFDFSVAGCQFHDKAASSKRFTRSSLKDIEGKQVCRQWYGSGKKRGKKKR